MNKTSQFIILALISIFSVVGFVAADGIGTIPQLQQFVATTSPSSAITQQVYGRPLYLTGLTPSTGICTDSNGFLTTTGCPAGGGGGSGGGTFSTTTSNVAGRLINYPNNTTDIVNIGSNSTTTGKFYFDPNIGYSFLTGTSTIGTALQIGATSGDNALKIATGRIYPASVSTGGAINCDEGTQAQFPCLVIHNNSSGAGTGRLLVINQEGTAVTQDMILASSSGANVTAFNVKGFPTGKGILKIEHTGGGTGFSNASLFSGDLLNCTDCQGIFLKGSIGGTGKLINFVDSSSGTLGFFDSTGLFNSKYSSSTIYSSFVIASSTNYFGAGLSSCAGASNALTWTGGIFGCNTISGTGLTAYDAFTHPYAASSATTSTLYFNNGFASNASSSISSLLLPALSQGLVYTGTSGIVDTTATTSATCAGTLSCTSFTVLGSSPITLTGSGGASSGGGVGWATSTADVNSIFSYGTGGVYVRGNSASATSSRSLLEVNAPGGVMPFYVGSSTSLFEVDGATGNIGIGTTTPPSPLTLNPTPNQLVSLNPLFLLGTSTLSGASAAGTYIGANAPTGFTGNMIDFQLAATSRFKVANDGTVTSNSTANFATFQGNASTVLIRSTGGTTGAGTAGITFNNNNSPAFTSGTGQATLVSTTFAPTSGNAAYDFAEVQGTVNQTGTAVGISRGYYANPTLTRAYDYRALEIAGSTYNMSVSTTTLVSTLFNAPTFASTSAATLTNGYTKQITGAPIASTNVTIATSTALFVGGGAVNGGGSVISAYGLQVFSSTGALNNYAATFMNGNVGIGTTTPTSAQMVVASSTGPQISLSSGVGIPQWVMRNAGGDLSFSTTTATGSATTSTAALTLTGSGKPGVAISSSTPNATLTVESRGGDFSYQFYVGSSTSPSMYIDNAKHIFIPNITAATGGTNQTVCFKSTTGELIDETTTACAVSSAKFKKNIANLDISGLDLLMQLHPVSYSYKDDVSYDYQNTQYGFIAEQVAAVDPHLAEYGTDGLPRTLDDRAILASIVKAVQELAHMKGAVRSIEENFQWLAIIALFGFVLYQQKQIKKLQK